MRVVASADYERVAALPRRTATRSAAAALVPAFSEALRVPGSSATLLPWQAYALAEALRNRGALLGLPVGAGKTLICELLPVVLRSRRPMLVLPGSLREKTEADRAAYARDWHLASPPPRIVTTQSLQREGAATMLDELRPDLVIVDECDWLANFKSSMTRRLWRYRREAGDACVFVAMSGTLGRKSILDYWHLALMALGPRAPLPLRRNEAEQWAAALDLLDDRRPRIHPGALGSTVEAAREWYARRLRETPGVVIVDEDTCKAPLTVRLRYARDCADTDAAYDRFLRELETPGGELISDPLSRWRLDCQIGSGFYLRYNPPPPEEWREARKAFARFVRDAIDRSTHSARPLDTEAQVIRRYREHAIVKRWLAVKPTFTPVTEPVWISDAAIKSCIEWLRERSEPGIVWCGAVEFGNALSRAARLPYYGPQGRDAHSGKPLHAANPRHSAVISWQANKQGFNLQAWTRQLIAQPPQSAKWLEQIFGRSHRQGQDKAVTVDVLITSGGTLNSFDKACAEAEFLAETLSMRQKLFRAEVAEAEKKTGLRWAR